MKKQRIKLKLKSYDHSLLEKAVKHIALTAKRTGAELIGPIPLPNERKCFSPIRSPHIDKKSREQFELTKHMRILHVLFPSDVTMNTLTMNALMKLNISSSVEVEIK